MCLSDFLCDVELTIFALTMKTFPAVSMQRQFHMSNTLHKHETSQNICQVLRAERWEPVGLYVEVGATRTQ